jgi:hypothetical protein
MPRACGVSCGIAVSGDDLRNNSQATLLLTNDAGSSRGRGNRAAAWFGDYIQSRNDSQMESLVLVGGIKGWVAGGEEYIRYVQEYTEAK